MKPLADWKRRLGLAIRARRESLGLTQPGLALGAGMSQATVSRIERGEGNPDVVQLRALAATLATDAATLIGEADAIVPCPACGGTGRGDPAAAAAPPRRADVAPASVPADTDHAEAGEPPSPESRPIDCLRELGRAGGVG